MGDAGQGVVTPLYPPSPLCPLVLPQLRERAAHPSSNGPADQSYTVSAPNPTPARPRSVAAAVRWAGLYVPSCPSRPVLFVAGPLRRL